jgi:hypothetical protein
MKHYVNGEIPAPGDDVKWADNGQSIFYVDHVMSNGNVFVQDTYHHWATREVEPEQLRLVRRSSAYYKLKVVGACK